MLIIAAPYERYETYTSYGERRTVITGRVQESSQWVMVVFIGDPETGSFLTAYHNKNLARRLEDDRGKMDRPETVGRFSTGTGRV